jgi:hypothetical protein
MGKVTEQKKKKLERGLVGGGRVLIFSKLSARSDQALLDGSIDTRFAQAAVKKSFRKQQTESACDRGFE